MMDLYDYYYSQKKKSGLTIKMMAEQLGCTRVYLNKMISRKGRPGLRLAKTIEKYTEGRVTVHEMLGIAPSHTQQIQQEENVDSENFTMS